MNQNAVGPSAALPWQEALEGADKRLKALQDDLHACRTELGQLGETEAALEERVSGYVARLGGVEERAGEVAERTASLTAAQSGLTERTEGLQRDVETLREEVTQAARQATSLAVWRGEHETSLRELAERFNAREERLAKATLIGWPRQTTALVGSALGVGLLLLGAAAGWLLPH
jgi:chromosome segregation ATPase